MRSAWFSASCALALIYAATAPHATVAQETESTSKVIGSNRTQTQNQTANRANTATSSTKASTSSPAKTRPKSTTSAAAPTGKSKQASARRKGKRRTAARGQQKIDSQRAQAIQEALIREHYLSSEAAGTWNQASEDAMRRYQADHGWQSKTVPDSRALISLGLGPSHDHLLNPDSAMTTAPTAPHAASLTPASHSAEPGAPINTTPATTPGQDGSGPQ
ncbi:MAG: hypothetical protein WB660_09980 [Candidatus Sulfotelmatobacter sp.]